MSKFTTFFTIICLLSLQPSQSFPFPHLQQDQLHQFSQFQANHNHNHPDHSHNLHNSDNHPSSPLSTSSKPNIVYILVDDWGWANVGYHNPRMQTPFLDSLLYDSIKLTHFYTFQYCSPTRSSFLSGRLPYHVNELNEDACQPRFGIPLNMTIISDLLSTNAGYICHQIGKWNVGMSSNDYLPIGRGFTTSLGYLQGAEDHYTQIRSHTEGNQSCSGVDLWYTDQPAYGMNGTYGGYIYGPRAVDIINKHNTSLGPLFIYLATQNNHSPYEVPTEYENKFNSSWYSTQRTVAGQSNFLDEMIKNITTSLKDNNLWNNTLLIITSDNGGPSGSDGDGGNNSPYRGGKYSNFQGGIRVNALVSGGLIYNNGYKDRRNITLNGTIHIVDWYCTFARIAGIECIDDRDNNMPELDSIDMWDYLIGNYTNENDLNISYSGRNSIYLMSGEKGGYLKGNYKLIFGQQKPAFWTTYDYPNGTTGLPTYLECGSIETQGCFFDIANDPTEHHNLINDTNYKQIIEELRNEFILLSNTTFNYSRGDVDPGCCDQIEKNNGYWGPWMN